MLGHHVGFPHSAGESTVGEGTTEDVPGVAQRLAWAPERVWEEAHCRPRRAIERFEDGRAARVGGGGHQGARDGGVEEVVCVAADFDVDWHHRETSLELARYVAFAPGAGGDVEAVLPIWRDAERLERDGGQP